jgi:hypothetical protein
VFVEANAHTCMWGSRFVLLYNSKKGRPIFLVSTFFLCLACLKCAQSFRTKPAQLVEAAPPCSFGLSASQQYFSLRTNQPPTISQQYFSLRTNQHQPSATSHQPNEQAERITTMRGALDAGWMRPTRPAPAPPTSTSSSGVSVSLLVNLCSSFLYFFLVLILCRNTHTGMEHHIHLPWDMLLPPSL